MIIICTCDNCRTRFEVDISRYNGSAYNFRCPNCGLAEVNPEEDALPGYTIRDGELVKK